jgi:hypothetical protein
MGEKPISPLRQRMIEDMMVRNFVAQLPAEAKLMSSQNPLLVRDAQTCNQAMMGDRRDATAWPRVARRRLRAIAQRVGI